MAGIHGHGRLRFPPVPVFMGPGLRRDDVPLTIFRQGPGMTRIPPLALLAFAAAAPAAAAERHYSITDFDRVQVDGPYRVTLATGRSSAARAEGSTEALDHVSIDVQGGILRIRRNRSAWGGYP